MRITAADEMFTHQIVSTFQEIGTSDLQWTERTCFCALDPSGKIYISVSVGKYTNRNVMDAYMGVVVDGARQYVLRASRELYPDYDTLKVGPCSCEVVEPLMRTRYRLEDNDLGISFDVKFKATTPFIEEVPHNLTYNKAKLTNHMYRMLQEGKSSATVTVEGKTYEFGDGTLWCNRDRSWGIRASTAIKSPTEILTAPGMKPHDEAGMLWHYATVMFNDYGFNYTYAETPEKIRLGRVQGCGLFYPYGDPRKPVLIIGAEHEVEYFPGSRRVKSARAIVTTAAGEKKEISIKPLSTFYSRVGGYLGWRDFSHGVWKGPLWVDGVKHDLTDEGVLNDIWGCDYIGCECRCGNDIGYGWLSFDQYVQYEKLVAD